MNTQLKKHTTDNVLWFKYTTGTVWVDYFSFRVNLTHRLIQRNDSDEIIRENPMIFQLNYLQEDVQMITL